MIATSNSLNKARVLSSCVHAFSLPVNRLKNRVSTENPSELSRGGSWQDSTEITLKLTEFIRVCVLLIFLRYLTKFYNVTITS